MSLLQNKKKTKPEYVPPCSTGIKLKFCSHKISVQFNLICCNASSVSKVFSFYKKTEKKCIKHKIRDPD